MKKILLLCLMSLSLRIYADNALDKVDITFEELAALTQLKESFATDDWNDPKQWKALSENKTVLGAFEKYCAAGDKEACVMTKQVEIMPKLATISQKLQAGDASQIPSALSLLEQSCEIGNGYFCYLIAQIYRDDPVNGAKVYIKKDVGKAAYFFKKACHNEIESDNLVAITVCRYLGDMYQKGMGVPKDTQKADVFYKKALQLEENAE
ncbi:MAG: sel1 repeat family protein [Neisseriaceae bacterium]|nr:sel1 repeat family protein [Neisseriaceae bacterium]